jgi:hypothetical protein
VRLKVAPDIERADEQDGDTNDQAEQTQFVIHDCLLDSLA